MSGKHTIHEVVVDWSWAEINAVIRGFNNLSTKQYIQLMFEIFTANDGSMLKGVVALRECSSHLTKTMKSDVKKYFKDYSTRRVAFEILGSVFECRSWTEAKSVINAIMTVFQSPNISSEVTQALERLRAVFSDLKWEEQEEDFEVESFERRDQKEMYKDSAFYQVNCYIYVMILSTK